MEKEIVDYRHAAKSNVYIRRCLDIALLSRGVYLAPAHVCFVSAATTEQDIKQTLRAMTQCLVELEPVPAITGTLPATRLTTASITLSCSG